MSKKKPKKAQVSIEALLLAGVIIMISVSVFGYYIQIRDSTTGIELIKLRALKKIEETKKLTIVEKIDYRIDIVLNKAYFCMFTDPDDEEIWGAAEETALEGEIEAMTGFGTVDIQQNPDPSPCE